MTGSLIPCLIHSSLFIILSGQFDSPPNSAPHGSEAEIASSGYSFILNLSQDFLKSSLDETLIAP
jgi:hypothetical protein